MKKSDKKRKKSKSSKRRYLSRKAPGPLADPAPFHVYEPREAPVVSPGRDTEELLSRARMQWQFGDWDSLGKLDILYIEHHPNRAELALLVGCAALQAGERDKGGAFLTSAIKWGGDSRLIFRLLVSGVHNTLARYNALIGNEEKGKRFLQLAATGLGGDPQLIGEVRRQREMAALPGFHLEKPATRLLSGDRLKEEASSDIPVKAHEFSLTDAVAEAAEDTTCLLKPGIQSYAQNFEDVMLWRALKDIEGGFYIDIGAQGPLIGSVSKAFYEKGWRGIHVEPTHAYARLLREDRPDETVIEAAVSDEHGFITFYDIPEGLSTGDPSIAAIHREKGFQIKETRIPTVTLADVFALAGDREIHWLKVDVEGMENNVLQSWGNAPQRPWIAVVESTVPNSKVETHGLWEGLLNKRDYTLVYFDGLNRFYLSKEHDALKKEFTTPPNVFDRFWL